MRILFVNNHCLSDPTAGVTQSFRTILRWWQDGGHDVTAVTTATFESPVPWTIEEHLAPYHPHGAADGSAYYALDGVNVHLYPTMEQQFALHESVLFAAQPDVLVVQGSHPLIAGWLGSAKARGIRTVRTVRSFRYYNPIYYLNVDHVFTCSQFLQLHYQLKIGKKFDVLAPPLDWSCVKVPDGQHDPRYITFIQPRKHKGWNAIQRLAQMLGERRPDIPLRVVLTGYGKDERVDYDTPAMTAARSLKFVAPMATPADWCSFTKILLVPSVWDEPWGRVAAEAMVNGIVPIVSDRGALPEVVGTKAWGSVVLPLPDWLLSASGRLPTEDEMQPWFAAICDLWDDEEHYLARSANCRAYAAEHFSESASRQAYLDYLQTVHPASVA